MTAPHLFLLGSLNVRVPIEFLHWLQDQAAEEQSSPSTVVRNCVAAAIVRAGDAEKYGIPVVDDTADDTDSDKLALLRRRSK